MSEWNIVISKKSRSKSNSSDSYKTPHIRMRSSSNNSTSSISSISSYESADSSFNISKSASSYIEYKNICNEADIMFKKIYNDLYYRYNKSNIYLKFNYNTLKNDEEVIIRAMNFIKDCYTKRLSHGYKYYKTIDQGHQHIIDKFREKENLLQIILNKIYEALSILDNYSDNDSIKEVIKNKEITSPLNSFDSSFSTSDFFHYANKELSKSINDYEYKALSSDIITQFENYISPILSELIDHVYTKEFLDKQTPIDKINFNINILWKMLNVLCYIFKGTILNKYNRTDLIEFNKAIRYLTLDKENLKIILNIIKNHLQTDNISQDFMNNKTFTESLKFVFYKLQLKTTPSGATFTTKLLKHTYTDYIYILIKNTYDLETFYNYIINLFIYNMKSNENSMFQNLKECKSKNMDLYLKNINVFKHCFIITSIDGFNDNIVCYKYDNNKHKLMCKLIPYHSSYIPVLIYFVPELADNKNYKLDENTRTFIKSWGDEQLKK